MAGERTEKATPKRREDARKRGQIARGPKLPAAAGFLTALLVMRLTGQDWLKIACHCFTAGLSRAASNKPLTQLALNGLLVDALYSAALLVLPVLSAVFVAGMAGNFAQGGFSITPQALAPKLDRFSPAANVKRIFSTRQVVEMLKSFTELAIICVVGYKVISNAVLQAPSMVGLNPSTTLASIGAVTYEVGLKVGGVLLVFAAIDYGYKRYVHEQSLRMSKQDIKDEYKHEEGDPMMKGRRRKSARALLKRRLMVEVPKADVVITNPTHFAVALLYDSKKAPAPVVVAKGADLMALRIRKIARDHSVPIVENPPLARVLYRDVEPGQYIPAEFFRAVAEILAYVYKQRQQYLR